jgi:pimeloyl-ACP methyl ester carboxylesterase
MRAGARGAGAFVVLVVAVLVAAIPLAGAASAASSSKGRQVDIGGGRRLYLRCAGSGSPTVVLESGIHDSSDPWTLTDVKPPVPKSPSVFAGLAKVTRVCAYDRPGTIRYDKPDPHITARSTAVDNPRTLDAQAGDLAAVLARGKVPGPYLMVAHSYGGMIVRRYAQQHPDEVAGIVFVDAFAPSIKPLFGDLWPRYEELLNHPGLALDRDPTWETVDADEAIATLESGPGLPAVPVAVVSKTLPFGVSPETSPDLVARLEQAWPEVQDSIVKEVGASQPPHVFATGSDHYVQLHDPDLVIATVKLVLERITASKGR